MQTKVVVRAGLIAALYIALTGALAPISFGPLQFRVAETLTVLPILFPEAVPALFVGVLISNIIFGGLGMPDIIGGSLTTLIAAYVTYRYRRNFVAYLSPVVFNAVCVSAYLSAILNVPYLPTVLSIGASEALIVLLLGYPVVQLLKKKGYGA